MLTASALVSGAVIAGCAPSPDSPNGRSAGKEAPTPTPTPTPASLNLSAEHPLTEIEPGDSLTFTVTNGSVDKITVTNADKEDVEGTFTDGVWKPKHPFRPSRSYEVHTTLANADPSLPAPKPLVTSISTVKGEGNAGNILYEDMDDAGIGMPVIILFNHDVVDKDKRAAIEKAMTIEVSPEQEGSWGWLDGTHLMWRPKQYWKPGTKVSVKGDFGGLKTASNRWLLNNLTGKFSIGKSRVVKISTSDHRLDVFIDGKKARSMPCTTGKSGFITRSGTKVIIEREADKVMDASTIGISPGSSEYYNLEVKWALRITYTGEFIHAAPWSSRSQGRANVSHGCVGLATDDAKWLFKTCRAGDIVETTGSNRHFKPEEGIGCWVYDWAGWQKLSAV